MTALLCRCPRPEPLGIPGRKVQCGHCGRTLSLQHWKYRSQRNAGKRADVLRRRRARG